MRWHQDEYDFSHLPKCVFSVYIRAAVRSMAQMIIMHENPNSDRADSGNVERFGPYLVVGLAVLIIAQIIFYQPFYGLMDDASHLQQTLAAGDDGLVDSALSLIRIKLVSQGRFQPMFAVMVAVLYQIGLLFGPIPLFVVNALFVFTVLYLNAHVLEQILGIDKWKLLLFALAFPYTYDLLQHPSLQEKLVMLFGALLLMASVQENIDRRRKALIITLWTILGSFSKEQSVIYLAAAFVALISVSDLRNKKDRLFLGYVALLDLVTVLVTVYLISTGDYHTGGAYSVRNAAENISSPVGFFFLGISIIGAILYLRPRYWRDEFEQLIPLIGVISFTVMLLPWRAFGGYLLSVVVLFLAALLVQLLNRVTESVGRVRAMAAFATRQYWVAGLAIAAVGMTWYRPYTMFVRLNDISKVVSMASLLESQGIKEIEMPCEEGSLSMAYFLEHYGGTSIAVRQLLGDSQVNGKVILHDSKMCGPLSMESAQTQMCRLEYLYQSPLHGGYTLVRFECEP